MNKKNNFYVTTPIYYGTAKPHLGSLYSTLIADVAARWNKLLGKEIFFLTGTDEHGQKIAEAAGRAGVPPKEFVDSFIPAYKDTWRAYEIQYDRFIRTTDEYHVKAVQHWLQNLLEKGDIYKSFYTGWYCIPCETFVAEKQEEDGKEGPPCPDCDRITVELAEESYFFKLSAYQDRLLEFYKNNPDFIVPKERMAEVLSFVKSGLKDLSISRTTVKWGIPFPNDDAHVAYVWADALNNYITAIGYGQKNKEEEFEKWWPANLQVLGKDIVRFHAVYWPAFLMASGLPLPKRLLVHGWIKVDQKKMSKSLGNVIDPMVLKEQYGADAVRYYLMRKMAINQDGNFSTQDLEQTICSELANDLGNLLNRVVSLSLKNGVSNVASPDLWSESAMELRSAGWATIEDVTAYMEDYQFHMALARLWKYINQLNSYVHAHEPWKLAKKDKAAFVEVIAAVCHGLRIVGTILLPFMPEKAAALLQSIGIEVPQGVNMLEHLDCSRWAHSFTLTKVDALFIKPEITKEDSVETKEKAEEKTEEQNVILIDDVIKVEILAGTIEKCEEVPKSNKLLKMQVNFGQKGMRQIFAGVKKFYTPEDLIGKQSIFVYNLKPRKMLGLESQGMMMLAKDANGGLQIVAPTNPVPNGTRLQ